MDDLMTDFDVIVVGTGMTESILAAALSRIGKSVLHLDSNEYYGENWASFNFDGIQNWIERLNNTKDDKSECEIECNNDLKDNETAIKIKFQSNIQNIEQKWYAKKKTEDTNEQITSSSLDSCDIVKGENVIEENQETKIANAEEFIRHESRRFNLDLCPKVLFSRGPLVELLISSNIAKYAEFKSVTRVLTWWNEHLELVPCSRADVFSTKNITIVEKRLLVKILTLFSKYPENADEFSDFENKTFIEYLKHKKLPSNILHYILYAMAMGDENMTCLDGVKASKTFLESLGRYGNTPFIFPMYGSGELPQCFCRLCAVFGGVYCLKRSVEFLIVKDGNCTGIMSENKRLNAGTFIFSSNYIPSELIATKQVNKLSRGIFIVDRSILSSEKESLTLLLFPPVAQVSKNSVTVVELGPGTNTCPEKVHLVHLTASSVSDAASDLRHVVDVLFESEGLQEKTERPRILWSLTWNLSQRCNATSRLENLKICSGPSSELDFNHCISEARRLFEEICPGEEFLPRAPDPDEIVLDSDQGTPSEQGEAQESKPGCLEDSQQPQS